jgi:spore photoproduct lyase
MVNPRVATKEYPLLDGSTRPLIKQVGDGSIITRFEKTPPPKKPTDVVCPHFLELKWGTGCLFHCSWCYLNGTLRFAPKKTKPYFKDFAKIEQHVRAFLENVDWCEELLNTGELSDSLMYERNGNPFSKFILSLFGQQERHKVLFLTKDKYVNNLLQSEHKSQAIVSFSLNADEAAKRFENGAPSVAERIEAADRISKAGYEVRIRIDPMVPIPNWEEGYKSLVDQIFSKFVPSRITLGSLRGLQSTINQATDKSWVNYLSERSSWGKRIAFDTRYLMYYKAIDHLKEKYAYTDIGLCKETLQIWEKLGMDYRRIKCNCIL